MSRPRPEPRHELAYYVLPRYREAVAYLPWVHYCPEAIRQMHPGQAIAANAWGYFKDDGSDYERFRRNIADLIAMPNIVRAVRRLFAGSASSAMRGFSGGLTIPADRSSASQGWLAAVSVEERRVAKGYTGAPGARQ